MGVETYNILKSEISPALLGNKSFDALKTILSAHFTLKHIIIIAKCFKFFEVRQEPGESIVYFVDTLKADAKSCNFVNFLGESLPDRFVCGLSSSLVHRKLLGKEDLTFEKAYNMASSYELTDQQSKLFITDTSGDIFAQCKGVNISYDIHLVGLRMCQHITQERMVEPAGLYFLTLSTYYISAYV